MNQTRSRQFVTFLLIIAAMAFGMVLAGGLEMTPSAVSGPAAPPGPVGAGVVPPSQGFPNFADLAEAVDPAVASIQAATIERRAPRRNIDPFEYFFGPRRRPQPGPEEEQEPFRSDSGGSGFVVSADGLVVTNYHVVRGADEVTVVLGGRNYTAEVRGTDAATDIALLKIDVDHELTYLRLGDSDAVRVGEWVMAVGSPLNLAKSVTVGVVSAKGRSLGISDVSFENFIQTDAAINFGNSGGPLINLAGEVIGINTAINYGAENIGFAVPANTVRQILPQLRDEGRVRRGYLGIEIRNLDFEAAEAYGLESTNGALVVRVVPGQPAAEAGVQPEDIIIRVDGLTIEDTRDLIDHVSAKGPDANVELELIRNGERKTLTVELAERGSEDTEASEQPEEEEGGIEWLGVRYQDMSPGMRASHGVPEDVSGVWITSVAPTSPLYEEGLRSTAGLIQIITGVNGQDVGSVAEFEEAVRAARSGSRLRLYVRRFAQGEEVQPILAFPQVP